MMIRENNSKMGRELVNGEDCFSIFLNMFSVCKGNFVVYPNRVFPGE